MIRGEPIQELLDTWVCRKGHLIRERERLNESGQTYGPKLRHEGDLSDTDTPGVLF